MALPEPHEPEDAMAAEQRFVLSQGDQRALDALIESGFVPGREDDRQQRVSKLLSRLDAGPAADAALVDATLARILRADAARQAVETRAARTNGGEHEVAKQLSLHDGEALDSYINSGHSLRSVPSSLRARAERVEQLGAILTSTQVPSAGRELLIERTLAGVAAARAVRPVEVPQRRGTWRWADMVSVAATLLVGASVMWPLMSAWGKRSSRVSCAGNMNSVAQAMGVYTGDQRGSLPLASASLAGLPWWETGRNVEHSNSANLFTLRRAQYATMEQLRCGGNATCRGEELPMDARDWSDINQVSYSYFVMFGDRKPQWSDPSSTVVLADASPVVRRAVLGNVVYANENSWNHGGEGQWALRVDGSAIWLRTPMHMAANGQQDNIWLPANVEEALAASDKQWRETQSSEPIRVRSRRDAADTRASFTLDGRETPQGADDSFLGP